MATEARRLEGKVALVTGGASGLGEASVRLFSKHGAKIVVADIRTSNHGEDICAELGGPGNASFIHCDVTIESDVAKAVDFAVSTYGKLDIMFNNAGIADPIRPGIVNNLSEDFLEVLKVNLLGPFHGTKHAARVMIPRKSGNIIMMASAASVIAGSETHAYTSSKHGLVGLTKNAAVELGRYGIRVNALSPYFVPTPLVEEQLKMDGESIMKNLYSSLKGVQLTAEDVAEVALFLVSDQSKYVSGANLVVDGGFSVHNVGAPMPGLE